MRLFLAIRVPDPAAAALERLQEALPLGRPVDPETFHLTLAFLGETPDAAAERLHLALTGLRAPDFALRLSGLGTFGGRVPRTIWAGLAPAPDLTALHSKLRAKLHAAGLNTPRARFRPHVTLARLRQRPRGDDMTRLRWFLEDHGGFAAAPFSGEAVTLFRSELGPDGAHYTALARYPLTPRSRQPNASA